MSKTSQVWEDFMNSELGQKVQAEMKKTAQADQWSVNMDREPLYNADPGNKTELSKSETTQGVQAGGASMVGSEDRAPLYNTSPAPVPGGTEKGADATVEGLEDKHQQHMEVAMKAPTGAPHGEQNNEPEKWEGLQAAGNAVKSFTKEGQALELEGDEDEELESLIAELFEEDARLSAEEAVEAPSSSEEEYTVASTKRSETVALLSQLVKIANELDEQGQYSDADEITNVIKDEVKNLVEARKK